MKHQRIEELQRKLSALRAQDPHADLAPALQDALNAAEDDQEKAMILSRLASELHLGLAALPFVERNRRKFEAAEAAIRDCIQLEPDEPHHWIRLAEHFQYYATDLERALDAINKAIDKARQGNAFLRQAHGSRIRIALELRQFEYVEESLKALIAYRPPKDSPDVALEKDFIKKIPAGAVSDQLIASYKALLA